VTNSGFGLWLVDKSGWIPNPTSNQKSKPIWFQIGCSCSEAEACRRLKQRGAEQNQKASSEEISASLEAHEASVVGSRRCRKKRTMAASAVVEKWGSGHFLLLSFS